jgi:hypothetical protein
MKKSDLVILTVVGTVYGYSLFHHGNIYRDGYRSRQDCQRDWGRYGNECREERDSHGVSTGGYFGPSYEAGSRPTTRHPSLSKGTSLVQRGGFGRSGARFAGGS